MRFCPILVANDAKSAQFVLLFNRKKRIYTFIKGIYTRVTNEFELFADFSFGTFITSPSHPETSLSYRNGIGQKP